VQGLILPVLYPFEVIFVSRLLACSNEIINKRLAQFFPKIERVLGWTEEPLVASLVEDDWQVVCHDVLAPYS